MVQTNVKSKKGKAILKETAVSHDKDSHSALTEATTKIKRGRVTSKKIEVLQPILHAPEALQEMLPIIASTLIEDSQPTSVEDSCTVTAVQTKEKPKRGRANLKKQDTPTGLQSRKTKKDTKIEASIAQLQDHLLEMAPTATLATTKTNRRRAILVTKTVKISQSASESLELLPETLTTFNAAQTNTKQKRRKGIHKNTDTKPMINLEPTSEVLPEGLVIIPLLETSLKTNKKSSASNKIETPPTEEKLLENPPIASLPQAHKNRRRAILTIKPVEDPQVEPLKTKISDLQYATDSESTTPTKSRSQAHDKIQPSIDQTIPDSSMKTSLNLEILATKLQPSSTADLKKTLDIGGPHPNATNKRVNHPLKEITLKVNEIPDVINEAYFETNIKFNLKISTWNVTGLNKLVSKGGMNFLEFEKPDIFCLQVNI